MQVTIIRKREEENCTPEEALVKLGMTAPAFNARTQGAEKEGILSSGQSGLCS